jgi:hypothetical protein
MEQNETEWKLEKGQTESKSSVSDPSFIARAILNLQRMNNIGWRNTPSAECNNHEKHYKLQKHVVTIGIPGKWFSIE